MGWFEEAAKYGAAGAGAGMAAGPLGGIIGGIGGFIGGAVHGASMEGDWVPPPGAEMAFDPSITETPGYVDYYRGPAADAQRRQAAQMAAASAGGPDYAMAQQSREQQMALAEQLRLAASGQAPSAAELQMQQGVEASLRAQLAAAASQRGVRSGAVQQGLNQQAADMRMRGVQDAALLRAQEQERARGMYASHLQGMRGQDLGRAEMEQQLALANAGFQQQAYQTNAQLTDAQRARNDQMTQYFLSLGYNLDQAQRAAQMEQARMQAEVAMGQMSNQTQKDAAMMQAGASTLATVAQAAPAVATAASDRRVKKNVASGSGQSKALLDALKSYSYDYTDEKYGAGRQFGIMAQDLEKSEVGRTLVRRGDDGVRMVDTGKAAMAALASAADINARLSSLEEAFSPGGRGHKALAEIPEAA